MSQRIETLVSYWDFLCGLKDADPFWESISTTYTRQCIITKWKHDFYKYDNMSCFLVAWYKEQSQFWGRSDHKFLKRMREEA